MRRTPRRVLPVVVPCLLLLVTFAAPAAAVDEIASGTPPQTVEVRVDRLVETIDVKGAFAPRGAVSVAYRPDVYGGKLEVVEAVGPKRVREGELLVRFSDEDAVKQVRQAEHALRVARANLDKRDAEVRHKEEAHAIKLAQIETRKKQADEELELFLEVNKPLRIAQAQYGLEGSENRLKDQTEELDQLEKMYKADDLTEETEEIVLRRTRRNLARSRRSLEFARQRHKTFLEVTLPREEHALRLKVRERANELSAYRASGRISMKLAKMGLEKATEDFERQKQSFERLREDVDALRVRAPVDGLAVPGSFRDGKWSDVASTHRMLQPGGRAKARQVLYTIVHPGNVSVVTSVGEKDGPRLEIGQEVVVTPTVKPGARLKAVVADVMPVLEGGKIRVRLDLKSTDADLVPGQSCKAKIHVRVREGVLLVPAAAVGKHDGKRAVWIWRDGRAEPRVVKTGARQGDHAEIREGVEAGERILAERPPEDDGDAEDDEDDENDENDENDEDE